LAILVTLMMEAICSSKTSALTTVTHHNFPEDGILHSHHCENLKCYKCMYCSSVNVYQCMNHSFGIFVHWDGVCESIHKYLEVELFFQCVVYVPFFSIISYVCSVQYVLSKFLFWFVSFYCLDVFLNPN
jgi:hypothetical protein